MRTRGTCFRIFNYPKPFLMIQPACLSRKDVQGKTLWLKIGLLQPSHSVDINGKHGASISVKS